MSSETEHGRGVRGLIPLSGRYLGALFFAGLLVWVGLLMYWSWPWDWDNKLFPLAVGTFAVVLTGIHIFWLLFPGVYDRLIPNLGFLDEDEDDGVDEELSERVEDTGVQSVRSKSEREVYELLMLGWVIVLPILLYFGGFGLMLPIYTFAFGLFFLRDVKMALLITVLISVFIWLLFVVILDVQLWDGTLGLIDPFDYIPQPF